MGAPFTSQGCEARRECEKIHIDYITIPAARRRAATRHGETKSAHGYLPRARLSYRTERRRAVLNRSGSLREITPDFREVLAIGR